MAEKEVSVLKLLIGLQERANIIYHQCRQLLFIVRLYPINNVLCFSQHFSLGHSCICDVTIGMLLQANQKL